MTVASFSQTECNVILQHNGLIEFKAAGRALVNLHHGSVIRVEHLAALLNVGDLLVIDVEESLGDHFLVHLISHWVTLNLRCPLLGLDNDIFREEVDPVFEVGHDSIGSTPLSLTVGGITVAVRPHLIVERDEKRIVSRIVKSSDIWLL